jgi:hypothetical protein
MSYQPKTGAKCSCRPGVYRDNCPNCEGTGWVIDFALIRAEADTRRRENLQKPTRDYPGAEQMMRWQRDYK